jgi:hypothetical protein
MEYFATFGSTVPASYKRKKRSEDMRWQLFEMNNFVFSHAYMSTKREHEKFSAAEY